MKKLFTLISLLFIVHTTYAQQFAPVGAEWYTDANKSIFHAVVKKDTIINGTNCRQVVYTPHSEPYWDTLGFHLWPPAPLYVYNNADTVFIFNTIFGKFTPLYVFNVNDGDTVTLPLLGPNDGCAWFANGLGDSSFSFVVDSVRVVQYDTAYLQTVFTSPLDVTGKKSMTYPVYARVIGNLERGLLPDCASDCIYLAAENCAGPSDVRCYKDENYSIKLVTDDCAKGIKTSVPYVRQYDLHISISPNPASDVAIIRLNKDLSKALQLEVLNIDGKVVAQKTIAAKEASLDISRLPAGMYMVRLSDDNGVISQGKLAVVR